MELNKNQLKLIIMINPSDLAYINEREDFHSDKCGHCMSYVNDDGGCNNKFCSSKIPAGVPF